jgi:hypothetical protein
VSILNQSLAEPPPTVIHIIDHALATRAYFKTVRMRLRTRFAQVVIAGLFLAGRAPETPPI